MTVGNLIKKLKTSNSAVISKVEHKILSLKWMEAEENYDFKTIRDMTPIWEKIRLGKISIKGKVAL